MSKKSFVVIGLIIVMLAGVLYGQSALEIRAAATTAVSGWQQMASPGGDPVWVSPITRLTAADIERAEARTLPNGNPAVGVVFTADGAKKMVELSAAQANKPIALLLDGRLIWAPVVRGEIRNESVLSGLTPDQSQRLLTILKGR